jgi:2,4-dienoyl-CoA reductase-like NADH-dependent reductase (Old Yellow Enzyme family)/thioredoxin reductase
MNIGKWKLLEPVKVGAMLLRNRIVMPPMYTSSGRPDGSVTKTTKDYYSERARGGVGMIIVEYSYVDDKLSRAAPSQLGAYSDHMIAGLNELVEAIKANGAAALLQIVHGGRQCAPGATGRQPVAPSAIPCKSIGVMPRELTLAEIEEIQKAFVEAARRAKQAGFDGVEIHGAHGYLICEFLSSYTNKRTDKYGGGLENRALFALETIRKVRDEVGNGFTVGYRMSADEYVPGGLTLEETSRFAKMLEGDGVDYIHVSGAIEESAHHTIPPMYIEKAHLVHLAEGIKKVVTIPVITVSAHDVETAEEALRAGKADLVALGRALIADPEIPKKLASGRIDDIRPCIRGNEGCISRVSLGLTMRCEVNPACGREGEFKMTPAADKKRVVIVGGGIAGMEAARVAALRGHEVTIVEKEDRLGGHLVEASVSEFKEKTKQLLDWAINQVHKAGVKVQLNTEATPESIGKLKPEALIVAVGSDFIVPPIPGCDRPCAITAGDVLLGKKGVGHKVVVVGAGLIGCETALYIAEELKRRVTIVEMLDEMLVGTEPKCRIALTERLQKTGVQVHLGWYVDEIRDKAIVCTDKKWQRHEIEADSVVLATGLRARKKLVEKFRDLAPEVYVIGDCVEARKIYHAFEDAWRAGLLI